MNAPGEGGHPGFEPDTGPSRRPGHELGAARERAGVSLEEMASRLNLTRASVEAIERDDYQHLPTAAFVRGYLRAYARQVGMDGDQVVAEFDAICGEDTEPQLVVREGVPDPASGRGSAIAVLILVAVVLVGAGAWWLQQESAMGPGVEPLVSGNGTGGDDPAATVEEAPAESEQDPVVDSGDAVDAVTETATGSTPTSAGADDAAGEEPDAAVDTTDGTGGDADAETSADTDAPEPASGQQDIDAQPPDDTQSAGEPPQTGDETSPSEGEPEGPLATSSADLAATDAAATGPDRVEIAVDGESWLEVYDSRGRRLVYTLYSGNAPVVLNGWAPFEVFLGNAPAVTVRVDDQVIDPSPFVRSDNTARFLADSEGASQP